MKVIVAGKDSDAIAEALEAESADVARVDIANRPALEEAGIHEAETYVLTEVEQATTIAVAKDLNSSIRVVVYSNESIPDFATRQTDIVVDPALLDPDTVAEELTADGRP